MRKSASTLLAFSFGSLLTYVTTARADATITIDGNLSDWPSDAFSFLDNPGDMPPPFADIIRVWITNDNTAGNNGYLYLAIEFLGPFRENVGSKDIDVYVYLDVNKDGDTDDPEDRIVEITGDRLSNPPTLGAVWDGNGNLLAYVPRADWAYKGTILEARIPYSVLGLSHGADSFGVAFATNGHPNVDERSPEPGGGSNGFIVYNGGDAEPLAVNIVGFSATREKDGVRLFWATGSERDNVGFNVLRRTKEGNLVRLNKALISGQLSALIGANYSFFDPEGRSGDEYFIEDIETGGRRTLRGPVLAQENKIHLPLLRKIPSKALRDTTKDFACDFPCKLSLEHQGLYFVEKDRGGLSLRRSSGPVPVLEGANGYFFIGNPIKDRYADYEIVVAERTLPRLMKKRKVFPCFLPEESLPYRLELEEDKVYFVASPAEDPFHWAASFPGAPAQVEFELVHPARQEFSTTVEVYGAGDGEHRARLFLDGSLLGEFSWTGREISHLSFGSVFAPATGKMRLTIESASESDVIFVERVLLNYQRKLIADHQEFIFQAPQGSCLRISGLDENTLLFDITRPEEPVALYGYRIVQESDGTYSVVFRNKTARAGISKFLVASASSAKRPSSRGVFRPLALSELTDSPSTVILSYGEFVPAAQNLCAIENSARCRVIDVERIYDTFSFGRPGAASLKEFIETVLLPMKVSYVLLLGDATADSRGRLDGQNRDFVPAFFTRTSRGWEAVCDGCYAGIPPRLAIGRLPAESVEEVTSMVNKTISWARNPQKTDRIFFVADRHGDIDFEHQVKKLAASCLPVTQTGLFLFTDKEVDPASHLLQTVSDGIDALVFFGHAYLSGWSSPPLLTSQGAAALSNRQLFVSFSFSCFDGAFVGPWAEALAAALVKNPAGGAIASFAFSSLTSPKALDTISEILFCALTSGQARTFGEAWLMVQEKLAGLGPEIEDALSTLNLLGHPALLNPWSR